MMFWCVTVVVVMLATARVEGFPGSVADYIQNRTAGRTIASEYGVKGKSAIATWAQSEEPSNVTFLKKTSSFCKSVPESTYGQFVTACQTTHIYFYDECASGQRSNYVIVAQRTMPTP